MADKLKRYREKRDFTLTPEPRAEEVSSAGALRFVVQKHAASRLHYDFRLEYEGVLKSWAVTRGPSIDPHEKRLAVETEDHPLDYATFEGTIPAGEYGGGTVMVWDEGTWTMADGKDAAEGFSHGSLSFDLYGQRMKGRWHLQRMRPEKNRPPPWLLVKAWDSEARDLAAGGEDITDAFTVSVVTGRSMELIAGGDAVWHSNRGKDAAAPASYSKPKQAEATRAEPKRAEPKRAGSERARSERAAPERAAPERAMPEPAMPEHAASKPAERKRAGRAAAEASTPPARHGASKVPEFVEPMLCEARAAPPKGSGWLAEVKYDGYRALLRAAGGEVRVLTRSNKDWTVRFPDIARAAAALADSDVLLDGEIVVFDEHGRTRFDSLQKAFKAAGAIEAVYIAFDCLFDGGADVRDEPIEARKARVAALVGADGPVRYGDHIEGRGEWLFERAAAIGLEGIVAKRAGSPYRSGRHGAWVKVQARRRAPFVVGAWVESDKDRALGALSLGAYDGDRLVPVGRVGTGFSHAELRRLLDDFRTIPAEKSPFAQKLEGRGHRYVRPERVADVSFLTITDDGQLRHAVYHGMLDMAAKEVTLPSGHSLAQVDRAPVAAEAEEAEEAELAEAVEPAAKRGAIATKPTRRSKAAAAEAEVPAGEPSAAQVPKRKRPAAVAEAKGSAAQPERAAVPRPKRAGGVEKGPARVASKPRTKAAAAAEPDHVPKPERSAPSGRAARNIDAVLVRGKGVEVLGVPLTHPEKILFPEQQVTKLMLAEHYVRHMERLLPQVSGRPLTLVRCPQGRTQKCFFQRHPEGLPARMARDVGEEDGAAIVIEAPEDVIELVQKGVLEIHLRGSHADKPDFPDRLVFDLDPGEGVTFAALKEAAFDVRRALAAIDLVSFVKTTGGKGLHVVVPVERKVAWDETKAWTRTFSEAMADAEPDRFLITMQKVKRKNRIFIDYLRNDRKASAVAPYSSRSREGAPFSFPIDWEDLEALAEPAPLHIGEEAPGDPWAAMDTVRQRLTPAHLKMGR